MLPEDYEFRKKVVRKRMLREERRRTMLELLLGKDDKKAGGEDKLQHSRKTAKKFQAGNGSTS